MQIINEEDAKIINDFEQAALLFGEIQQEHALYLQRNQLADVQKWSDERARAMGILQNALTAVWRCDSLQTDADLGRSLQKRVGEIVARERELAENVKSCQEQLKGEMGKMRKGKKVLGGYGETGRASSTGLCYRNAL